MKVRGFGEKKVEKYGTRFLRFVQSYIYIGKGDVVQYSGEKPITVEMQLQNKIPVSLYTEFIKKV